MSIDAGFVDVWNAAYNEAANRTPFRLARTRLGPELARLAPARHARLTQLHTFGEFESYLFTTIGAGVRANGAYAADEFLSVGYWKSPRPIGYYLQNRAARIRTLSHEALRAAEPWHVLSRLRGVGIPVASALLAVWHPDRFTILDFRALHALGAHNENIDGTAFANHPFAWWKRNYELYVRGCNEIAERVARPLRDVDRALWRWSRANDRR